MTNDDRELPVCPRCGYDQSGIVAAWTSECPLQHTCSECGFVFDVARVLNPRHYCIDWFFEHGPRRRLGLLEPWRTWYRAVLPWRFWRERDGVRLDSEFSLVRLLAWLPMLVAPVWVLTAIVSSGQVMIWYTVNTPSRPLTLTFWAVVVANSLLEPLGVGYFSNSLEFHFEMFLPYHVKAWILCCVLMPILILTLHTSRLTCRVRPRHVLRASVYGFGLVALWPIYMILSRITDAIPWPSEVMTGLGLPWSDETWFKAILVSGLLGITWFASWWYVVIVRVFRFRHARAVWALLMFACVLVFVITAAVDGGLGWLFVK